MSYAVSFCDCMELSSSDLSATKEIDYIYGGSYFCDHYFMYIPNDTWKNIRDLAKKQNSRLVLVVPIPGQMMLDAIKEKILSILEQYNISEIVVNDYAMYEWINERVIDIPIWFGRLLSKDIRDPRYELKPSMIKLLNRATQGRILGFEPYGIEADIVVSVHDIESEQRCKLALHTPISYLSTGRICEFASLGTELDRKFRPGMACQKQCEKNLIRYERNGICYYKIGRAIYAENPKSIVPPENTNIRIIDNMLIRRLQK